MFDALEDVSSCILEIAPYKDIWGQGIEEPTIVVEHIKINTSDVQFAGTTSSTVKFTVNGVTYIKFKDPELKDKLMKNRWSEVTIYGKASINEWAGKLNPQILIHDYNVTCIDDDF